MNAGQDLQRRRVQVAGVAAALGLLLTGCAEVPESSADPYEPAKVEEIANGLKEVFFTAEGARRVDLKTSTAVRSGKHTVVDYAALIYDGKGAPWVYTVIGPLHYVRAAVVVDRVAGKRVLLSKGPPAGTKVVTVGASEVYGAELDIAGGH